MKTKMISITDKLLSSLALLVITMSVAVAGPYGYDLHNVLSPRAAGMAGTSIAGDHSGPVEAVFGNPANLADFQGGTNFTFGATLYYPEAIAKHTQGNNPILGGAVPNYRTRSQAEAYAVPQIAVTQDLAGIGIPVVLGMGLSAVSGIGVDYRQNDQTLGAGAEFISLGINTGVGYEVNPQLDIGAAITVTYAMIEAGLAGTSAQSHDYGIRATAGADYAITPQTSVGFYAQTEQRHSWSDAILLTPDDPIANPNAIANASYSKLEIEQPRNFALGIAHELNSDMRVMADVIYKDWSNAEFWGRLYHDQTAVSLGAEMDRGPMTFRVGYGYANDPTRGRVDGDALEGNTGVCTGAPGIGVCLPLTGAGGQQTWRYIQALEAPVIYRHRVTAGMTWNGFLAPFLTLDAHVAHQIKETRDYDYAHAGSDDITRLDVRSYHAGFALTWGF